MFFIACALVVAGPSQEPQLAPAHERTGTRLAPLTVAESSGYARSSRLDDVERFLKGLDGLPSADLILREVIGQTTEGRDIIAVTVANPGGGRASVIVNANIHGGEIEGKVAAQMLLREFALGEHAELLDELSITFIPVFNADGNDAISRRNRTSQNGPNGGVGQRPNGQGLDLNRDFVKLESPEVRALTRLANRLRPLAFMDLHTTNGSDHGYDLTYAPSLSPNAHPGLDTYLREALFPAVRKTLAERDGIQVFDYGNFTYKRRERGSRGDRGDPESWTTYDSRPRFGTNLMGLRGTLSILSEAYSYLPCERRVESTRAFVLECLRKIASDRVEIETLAKARVGTDRRLCVECALEEGTPELVLTGPVGSVTVDVDPFTSGVQEGRRRVAGPRAEVRGVEMLVRRRFVAGREVPCGKTLAVANPSDALLEILSIHLGAEPLRLKEERTVRAQVFVISKASRSERVFQGHQEVSLQGAFEERELTLPVGALVVESTPLTVHLLHPESDDSLSTWNLFDTEIFRQEVGLGDALNALHPVVLLDVVPASVTSR